MHQDRKRANWLSFPVRPLRTRHEHAVASGRSIWGLAVVLARYSLSVSAAIEPGARHRIDLGRRHVHEAEATKQKIAVWALFKVWDTACSWRVTKYLFGCALLAADHHDGLIVILPVRQRAGPLRLWAAAWRRSHDGGCPDSAAIACQVQPAARRWARYSLMPSKPRRDARGGRRARRVNPHPIS
jgi:hypothetical protein